MKKLFLGLVFLASNAIASDCGVITLHFGDDYAPRILRALESRGYKIVQSLADATYTFGGVGATGTIGWGMTAVLEKIETNESITASATGLFSNGALLKATKKLPRCEDVGNKNVM